VEHNQFNAISSQIIDSVRSLSKANIKPLLVAIDGGSGSGKSSIARVITKQLNATLIATDDFYAAEITHEGWVNRSYKQRAADVINRQSLRTNVLEPLMNGLSASWKRFDFDAGPRPDGTYNIESTVINYFPNDLIILEGAYSCQPELADLIHLKILIEVPVHIRHGRLQCREDQGFLMHWHERWDEAEQYYLSEVCPPSSFDIVIENI
jgi:uridine kinase